MFHPVPPHSWRGSFWKSGPCWHLQLALRDGQLPLQPQKAGALAPRPPQVCPSQVVIEDERPEQSMELAYLPIRQLVNQFQGHMSKCSKEQGHYQILALLLGTRSY